MSEPQTGAKRYPRTFGGLVGSMVVLVLAVVAYWVVQNLTHDQPEGTPVAVSYLGTVKAVQGAGITVAYPRSLPKGWIASHEPDFTPGARPVWKMAMLTGDDEFVGIHQANAPLADLLEKDLRGTPRQGADVRLESGLPGDQPATWTSWSSQGGDHAFATKLGEDTLVVYGSAPVEDLRTLVARLTTAPA